MTDIIRDLVSRHGGRHEGWIRQVAEYSRSSLLRAERSLARRITEHEVKVENAAAGGTELHAGHWRSEIRIFGEQLTIVREILGRRL